MAVSLAARKAPPRPPAPKYGPTAGPFSQPGKPMPAFQGGNDAWWRGLIAGQSKPGQPGIPQPLAQTSPIWQNYSQGLSSLFSGIGGYGGGRGGMNLGNQYAAGIGGDYGVQDMESRMNAAMGRARGDFQAQLRQGLIDLGVTDTSKLGNLAQYIDADTIQKAAENKYSAVAQSQQAEARGRAQSEADLAARGLLSSGQLTSNAENILAQGEQSRYSALRDFLGQGGQGLSQLADLNDQYGMQLAQARADAAAREAQLQYYLGMSDQSGYGGYGGGYGAPLQAPINPMAKYLNPVTGQAGGIQDLINSGVLNINDLRGLGYSPPPRGY